MDNALSFHFLQIFGHTLFLQTLNHLIIHKLYYYSLMNNLLFSRGLNNNMTSLSNNLSHGFTKNDTNTYNPNFMPYRNMFMVNMHNQMPVHNNMMSGNLNMNLLNNINTITPGLGQGILQNSINHNMPQNDQSMIFAQNSTNNPYQHYLMQSYKNYYSNNHFQSHPTQKFMMSEIPENGLNFNGLMGSSSSNIMLNENNITNPTSLQNLNGPIPKSCDNNTNNMLIK